MQEHKFKQLKFQFKGAILNNFCNGGINKIKLNFLIPSILTAIAKKALTAIS